MENSATNAVMLVCMEVFGFIFYATADTRLQLAYTDKCKRLVTGSEPNRPTACLRRLATPFPPNMGKLCVKFVQ